MFQVYGDILKTLSRIFSKMQAQKTENPFHLRVKKVDEILMVRAPCVDIELHGKTFRFSKLIFSWVSRGKMSENSDFFHHFG